jgi:hypothetical protein
MSATKEHYHDQIERSSRLYDVLELEKLSGTELHDLADILGIDPEIKSKQGKIYAILNVQSTTPAMSGDNINSEVSPPCKGGECDSPRDERGGKNQKPATSNQQQA